MDIAEARAAVAAAEAALAEARVRAGEGRSGPVRSRRVIGRAPGAIRVLGPALARPALPANQRGDRSTGRILAWSVEGPATTLPWPWDWGTEPGD
jgi:hypothetical protein